MPHPGIRRWVPYDIATIEFRFLIDMRIVISDPTNKLPQRIAISVAKRK